MENYFHFLWFLLISYILLILVLKAVVHLWWTPRRIENHFMKQGIKGPKYQLFLGNLKELASLNLIASAQSMPQSHNILPRVLSFYHHWKKIYGSMFLVWFGPTPRLTISDPALIREIFVLKSELFEKNESPPLVRKIEGDGLLSLKGEKWAHHRKIIQPTFHTENLKLMIPMMAKSMEEALVKWSEKMSNCGKVEIEVSNWFQNLVEDVITRATFGSSYEDGRKIFELQSQQMVHATEAYQKVFIPGYRFLPTKKNRISWRLEKEIRKSLLKLIDRRRKNSGCQSLSDECPNDLLELMIKASLKESADESSHSSPSSYSSPHAITANDVVEECKTIFFAGKHTTSNLLTWTAVLLAMHPQWQEQAREEVLRVCGARDTPTKDDLAKLKTLGMILNESLRLYPPAVAIIRRAKTDMQLGGLHILRGTELLIPILAVHHDPALWCHDAHEFNPARFAKGVAHAAKHPMAFMPFGMGARRCIGQNLAVLQAKLAIAMILQRFSFELSPSYQHAPSVLMLLHPQYGAPIVFRKL
ncbi:Cytochrome P450 CYP4/CYP19/CYP26 subfamily [Handroanthus impetiginosus]|uniref:Cytochrome P450 CYP4/CYP19/CYP26 subfamily n=1 Tax=Handroanthus impetiginosus TaxID=429701 RepID=A0A2G9H3H6_9LAMI|nr:Cytochrome P450 CYP4/CYP19/CYP26 subfamily [Handroanthus impetiginosus]